MNQESFEARILHLWMTTRVPLTRANVLFFTRVPRKKADRWLEALVADGVLDFDSDDEGEVIWTVRGAARPARGADKVEDVLRLEELGSQVRRPRASPGARAMAGASTTVPLGARGLVKQALARQGGEKSLLASGILSAAIGPFGWLYAGPAREALPLGAVYWLAYLLLPSIPILGFFLFPLFSIAMAGSGAIGVLHAWQYNRTGKTTALLTDDAGDAGGAGDDRPRLPGGR